jgi:thioredoxin 1
MEERNKMKSIMGRFFSIALLLLVVASNVVAFISKPGNSNVHRRLISLAGASPNVVELGDSNFRDLFNADKPVLIDACAKWCGPCKLIEPTIDRCADKRENSLAVCRYDVESDSDEVKLELLLQRVMPQALPSLILIKNNKVLGTRNGIITDDELDEFLNEHLSKPSNVDANEEIEEKSKRIERRGFIGFVNQVDDYMLNDDTF